MRHLRVYLFPNDKTELIINDCGKFQLLMSAFASEQLTKVRPQIINWHASIFSVECIECSERAW